MMGMRQFKVGLCLLDKEDSVVSIQALECMWSTDIETDMIEHHALNVKEEIAGMIELNIKHSITKETIIELLEEAGIFEEK